METLPDFFLKGKHIQTVPLKHIWTAPLLCHLSKIGAVARLSYAESVPATYTTRAGLAGWSLM